MDIKGYIVPPEGKDSFLRIFEMIKKTTEEMMKEASVDEGKHEMLKRILTEEYLLLHMADERMAGVSEDEKQEIIEATELLLQHFATAISIAMDFYLVSKSTASFQIVLECLRCTLSNLFENRNLFLKLAREETSEDSEKGPEYFGIGS